ncbi:MAG: Gmad2 immunoglobulin-like domain-containing protein [Anaerolineae bacterium]|jgi:heat shock protein HslJ
MSEEIIEPAEVEDTLSEESVPPAVAQEVPPEQPPAKKPAWVMAVIIIAAILLACCIVAIVIAAAVTIFSSNGEATPTPVQPIEAYISISEPVQGAILDITEPIGILGTGAGLFEGNVVVQVIDRDGNILAQEPTTLQGPDVGTGGEGAWRLEISVETQPGMAGQIRAFSPSPADGSVMAEDVVNVSLGSTPAVQAYIQIDEPVSGQTLDIASPIIISGQGAGLPEANVVVQALDRDGNEIASQPTTLQGPEVGTGGEGTWQVQLTIDTEPGMAGQIRAYSPSPADNSIVADARVQVTFGSTPPMPVFLEIDEPASGTVLDTSQPVAVSGTGGGLPEGNVVVRALDADNKVLAEQATTLQGSDVATGGEGTWSVTLLVQPPGGTIGQIVAFSSSPDSGENVAESAVSVTYGEESLSLEGPTWILERTLLKTEITAVFEEGKVTGSAGCNTYNGTYMVTAGANEDEIAIGPLATTRMACEEKIMGQETLYLSSLEAAESYIIEGTRLTIYYPGGALNYEAQEEE